MINTGKEIVWGRKEWIGVGTLLATLLGMSGSSFSFFSNINANQKAMQVEISNAEVDRQEVLRRMVRIEGLLDQNEKMKDKLTDIQITVNNVQHELENHGRQLQILERQIGIRQNSFKPPVGSEPPAVPDAPK